jgi:hypothetical protein
MPYIVFGAIARLAFPIRASLRAAYWREFSTVLPLALEGNP